MAEPLPRPGRRAAGLDPVLLCLGTLTALPVPAPALVNRSAAGRAMLLAPLAGVVPGAGAAAVAWAAGRAGLAPLPSAVLAIASVALLTRGLHLDGLADTADGLTASYRRADALAAMRGGETGPAGAAALVLVLTLQVAALAQALTGSAGAGPVAVLVAAVAARATVPVACTRGIPAARSEGLGALVAGTVPPVAAAGCVAGVAALSALAVAAAGLPWWRGPVAVLAAVLVAAAVLRRATTRFGGITGDVLGACVEVGTAAALVALAP